MARKKKLTPMVIARIRTWVEQGLRSREIAQNIGCTVGTLRVRCCQLGISLRKANPNNDRGANHHTRQTPGSHQPGPATRPAKRDVRRGQLLILMSPSAVHQLQSRAAVKGLSDSRLAATLLEKIAQDDLYDAVLDE